MSVWSTLKSAFNSVRLTLPDWLRIGQRVAPDVEMDEIFAEAPEQNSGRILTLKDFLEDMGPEKFCRAANNALQIEATERNERWSVEDNLVYAPQNVDVAGYKYTDNVHELTMRVRGLVGDRGVHAVRDRLQTVLSEHLGQQSKDNNSLNPQVQLFLKPLDGFGAEREHDVFERALRQRRNFNADAVNPLDALLQAMSLTIDVSRIEDLKQQQIGRLHNIEQALIRIERKDPSRVVESGLTPKEKEWGPRARFHLLAAYAQAVSGSGNNCDDAVLSYDNGKTLTGAQALEIAYKIAEREEDLYQSQRAGYRDFFKRAAENVQESRRTKYLDFARQNAEGNSDQPVFGLQPA